MIAGLGVAALGAVTLVGCGLGWIEVFPEQSVDFRIENGTPGSLSIAIVVETPAQQQTDGDRSDAESGKTITQTDVVVPGGSVTTGTVGCGDVVTVNAQAVDSPSSVIQLTGDGTGTPGFDSGSVGNAGERFLLFGTHYDCSETVVIQFLASGTGRITIVDPSIPLPDPVTPLGVTDPTEPTDPTDFTPGTATFRLDNATPTAVDVAITAQPEDGTTTTEAGPAVRVPAGQYTTGIHECGATYVITATMADAGTSAVLLTGDGTGTLGFDSSSIGLGGERFFVFGEHYACDDTIVVRITDDGSGIGLSTNDSPLGEVSVYGSGEAILEPDLPDLDQLEENELTEEVTLVLVNAVERTIQVNYATGSGTLASSLGSDISSEFDVRVSPGATTIGTGVCAQEYMIAASHLESTGTTFAQGGIDIFEGGGNINFHAVVLTGDGTGTEGFDSNTIAVARGRLFQLGTHFHCGDTITVIVTATNNRIKLNAEGEVVLDDFGLPTIKYGVGEGSVFVTSGG